MKKYVKKTIVIALFAISITSGAVLLNTNNLVMQSNITNIDNKGVNGIQFNLSTNSNSSFAIIEDQVNKDRLYAWGDNSNLQLGISNLKDPNLPSVVKLPNLTNADRITAVSTADTFTMLLVNNSSLFTVGSNIDGQLGLGNIGALPPNTFFQIASNDLPGSITEITASPDHASAIADQQLYSWGRNTNGQLGVGTTNPRVLSPTKIIHPDWVAGGSLTKVKSSLNHSSVMYNGGLYMWGQNTTGVVGNGTNTIVDTPTKVIFPQQGSITHFEFNQTAFAVIDNKLYGWGEGTSGEFGNGTTKNLNTPTLINVPTPGTIKAIKVLNGSTLLQIDDKLYATGANTFGQLGLGDNQDRTTFTELQGLKVLDGDVWMNTETTNYILTDHGLYAWGNNTNGQFGIGTNTNYNQPSLIDPFGGPSQLTTKTSQQKIDAKKAIQLLNPNNNDIDKKILTEYTDGIASFPAKTAFRIKSGTIPVVDAVAGTIMISLTADQFYNTPDGVKIMLPLDFVDFRIEGFTTIKSNTTITAKTNNVKPFSIVQWEELIKNNGKLTINDLAEYLELTAIPPDASFTISEINQNVETGTIHFKIQTDRYYDGNDQLQNKPSEMFQVSLQLLVAANNKGSIFEWWWILIAVGGAVITGLFIWLIIKRYRALSI